MRTKLHSVFCINKSRWVKYIFTDDKAVSACYKTTTACSLEWLLSSNYIRLHVHLPCTWRMHILALTVCTCHSLISSKYKHMSALSNVILSFRLIFFLLRNLTLILSEAFYNWFHHLFHSLCLIGFLYLPWKLLSNILKHHKVLQVGKNRYIILCLKMRWYLKLKLTVTAKETCVIYESMKCCVMDAFSSPNIGLWIIPQQQTSNTAEVFFAAAVGTLC